jgi:phosphatidylethanolamine-binding protein (PEBP) family uncharacterized protein
MTTANATATIALASADFGEGETLPMSMIYDGMGCTGENRSPDLHWNAAPAGTKSLVLTMHDPDAPTTVGFTHWLLVNLDPPGSLHGLNDMGQNAYSGPCPPSGDPPHRYRFTLYALDIPKLESPPGEKLTYPLLRFMIRDHVLATGTIMGRYGA